MKKFVTVFLSIVLMLVCCVPVFATGFGLPSLEDLTPGEGTEFVNEDDITTEPTTEYVFEPPTEEESTVFEPVTMDVEIVTSVTKGKRTEYNATFDAYVEDGVTDFIDISVQNLQSSELYTFRLFETNGFFKVVTLPEGEYKLVSGKAANDNLGKYPVETVYFTVGKVLNQFVAFNVGIPAEPYDHIAAELTEQGIDASDLYDEVITAKPEPTEEVPETDENGNEIDNPEHPPKEKGGFIKKLVPALFLLIIIALYVFKRSQRKGKIADNDDNFPTNISY